MYKQAAIPRSELLTWINSFFCTKYKKLEDASNGAIACQIVDVIHPNVISMKQLDFTASTEYDCQKNYKILRSAFLKLDIPINVDLINLPKQGCKESYEFLAVMKDFFDKNYQGQDYDPIARRKDSKGTTKITRAESKAMSQRSSSVRSSNAYVNSGGAIKFENYDPTSKNQQPTYSSQYNSLSPERAPPLRGVTSPGGKQQQDQTIKTHLLDALAKYKDENEILKKTCNDLEIQLDTTNAVRQKREDLLCGERLFYYNKLLSIEKILKNIPEEDLTQEERDIFDILYSEDKGELANDADINPIEGEQVDEQMYPETYKNSANVEPPAYSNTFRYTDSYNHQDAESVNSNERASEGNTEGYL